MDMLKSDVGKSFGKSGGEIIFVDGTLFRPKPTLAYNIEPEIIEKNIQIHRLVIGQGRLGSFDWLHELCNKTAGKEYITMTSRRIRKNTNSIYDPVSFFVNLNHKTINVLLTGIFCCTDFKNIICYNTSCSIRIRVVLLYRLDFCVSELYHII